MFVLAYPTALKQEDTEFCFKMKEVRSFAGCPMKEARIWVKKTPPRVSSFIIIYLLTAIGLLPGGSGYFTCKQNIKSVTTRFKSGGPHEKHVVATWNVGNRLSVCL